MTSYRYRLNRIWGEGPTVSLIGLNPSTADDAVDDATTRRLIGILSRLGFGSYFLVNLFAYRTKDPQELFAAWRRGTDICGPENSQAIREALNNYQTCVAMWGAVKAMPAPKVIADVRRGVRPGVLKCLGLTKGGAPRHPLYLAYDDVRLQDWPR